MQLKLPNLSHIRRFGQRISQGVAGLPDRFRHLSIQHKLNLGFGILVALALWVAGRSYMSNIQATVHINRTEAQQMPLALTSAHAQANLLRMLSDVRGYLATGESQFRDRYQQARQSFEAELLQMHELAEQQHSSEKVRRLEGLQKNYEAWSRLPNQLFSLRDNLLNNEPALRLLEENGQLPISVILAEISRMIQEQEVQSPSSANLGLLKDMVDFQSSFALMVSGLRGYLVTQNPTFRYEYAENLRKNQAAWEQLNSQRDALSEAQKASFNKIAQQRQVFLVLPDQMFSIVEGERRREDLFLFQTQVEPLAMQMLDDLDAIVADQQSYLTAELKQGKDSLIAAQWQTLLAGGIALGIGTSMALILRQQIADPVKRLTSATTRIMKGDFDTKAVVESDDEVGTLAKTFNQMTDYLKQSRQELEQYSHTLEQRVEERTQELQEKNTQLSQALQDLKKAQTHLIQTEKMSSLGQMVAGIAHEINNPVNFIYGNLIHADAYAKGLLELVQLYQEQLPQATPIVLEKIEEMDLDFVAEDLPKILHSMQVGAIRIREIVLSLRNFARLDEAELKVADLHSGLDSTLMILQNRLKPQGNGIGIQVIKEYGDLPPVECYPGQLNQVFMNILANAIDALEDDTPLLLQKPLSESLPERASLPEKTITIRTKLLRKKSHIVVQIIDNGPGMPIATQQRLFDPFFTTKPVGKGTGLGLAISHQIIVEKHHGILRCHSELGRGTEFWIEIPLRLSEEMHED